MPPKKLPARSQTAPPPPAVPAPAGDEGDLPEGWAVFRLAELTESIRDGTHTPPKRAENGVPLLSARNIQDGFIDFGEAYSFISQVDFDQIARTNPVNFGDVLLTIVGSLGRSCVNSLGIQFAVQRSVAIIRPSTDTVDSRFLQLTFQSPGFQRFLEGSAKGTAQKGAYLGTLREAPIPLPPLAEQRRMVGVLEALLGKVAASRERLARVPQLLKRFRQSVLAAACSGKLTNDWREENPDELPYDQNLFKESLDDSDVPRNWGQTSLGPLIDLVTSGSRGWAQYYSDAGSVFIRAQNINRDVLDLEDIAFVRLPNKAEGLRTRVQQHDMLITITGANVTKSALVDHQLDDAYVSQHVALVRLKDQRLARFLFHWILSVAHGRKQLQESAYGQGKPGLNLDNIRDVSVAIPPLAEQHEIVRRVEQLFALADRLEAQLAAARKRVDRLTQAILAKAFRGELVPTEADLARRESRPYEPASELLARIHRETKSIGNAQRERKPRSKGT